ncbi:HAD family hydrolase [Thermogemmatispora sp.]|uniref:HAD family hydrolase n=1 Tax=Thermogemmatispora sp. TaxID=1968838 RepID=UPI001DCD9AC9|nr:HAD-IA family hydrolase [Thermogemmatispora sp.]MBX5448476.1 HAD-IA family hydrolase [Thermogemmatispora sp.]
MITALIFDFDGLILETELPEFLAWQQLYALYGQRFELEAWLPYIGIGPTSNPFDPLRELERRLGHVFSPEEREALRQSRREYCRQLLEGQAVAEGVLDYLEAAERLGLLLGVASSSSRRWVVGHLERLGLRSRFQCICCGDDVHVTKPDPAVYLAVLRCLGVRPEEAIALEDSPNGVRAARRAGIFCVAVPSVLTRHATFSDDATPDLQLPSLSALPLEELLQRISALRTSRQR